MTMPVMEDKYGRRFRTLRVSLVNHCNLGCVYCVAEEGGMRAGGQGEAEGMDVESLLAMIGRLHARLGLRTIRLTGGEPLLYRELPALIAGIRGMGIGDIRLTTNGFLLERQAAGLRQAGLESVNVSLDAIDEELFLRMSRRRSAARVTGGIDAALREGLAVKINTVVMRGMNEGQILPLMDFAVSRGVRIRFLELMAMGHLQRDAGGMLFTQDEILSEISKRWKFSRVGRAESATTGYWRTEEGHYFGVIANESEPFCRDCDRLRLDSSGNIYGCLSSNRPVAMRMEEDGEEWDRKLAQALSQKQELRFTGSDLGMMQIGG